MTIILRITGFHNCDGCTRKVRITLRKIGGVELVEFDRESGNVKVSTAKHPEVIRYALERHLRKSVVILSRDIVPIEPHQVRAQPTFDLQEFGQVMLSLSHALNGIQVTQSNTIMINFNHRNSRPHVFRPESRGYIGVHIDDVGVDQYARQQLLPRAPAWATTEPSAPLMPTAGEQVYGYPPEFYGFPNHDHRTRCCNICGNKINLLVLYSYTK